MQGKRRAPRPTFLVKIAAIFSSQAKGNHSTGFLVLLVSGLCLLKLKVPGPFPDFMVLLPYSPVSAGQPLWPELGSVATVAHRAPGENEASCIRKFPSR